MALKFTNRKDAGYWASDTERAELPAIHVYPTGYNGQWTATDCNGEMAYEFSRKRAVQQLIYQLDRKN